MTEQTAPTIEELQSEIASLKKQAAASAPESGFSMNWQITDPAGVTCQFTARSPLLGDWNAVIRQRGKMIEVLLADGWTVAGRPRLTDPAAEPVKQQAAQPAQNVQPVPVHNGNGAHIPTPATALSFRAQTLSGDVLNGKAVWKVKGGQFTKFGVTVWPEVLESARLQCQAGQTYNLDGWTAEYIEKDGKPSKVVRLVPPGN